MLLSKHDMISLALVEAGIDGSIKLFVKWNNLPPSYLGNPINK